MKIEVIETKVHNFIKQHDLIRDGDNIIVATSGGADSMMLLHFLKHSNYKIDITCAHVNHMIREEAINDMEYVRNICNNWDITCKVYTCNIKQLAAQRKISTEECGRLERYNFFISLLNGHGKIATAHNANDQAETMLMRFFRGTDVRGLCGIAIKRDTIIRPILCLKRQEIEFYCQKYKINFKTDHTNFLPIYTRNRIRLDLMPYITNHINKNIVYTLVEHSQLYKEEEEFLESYMQDSFIKYVTHINNTYEIQLLGFEDEKIYIQKKLILQILVNLSVCNITSKHLDAAVSLITNQSGRRINLPNNIVIYRTQHSLRILVENLIKPLLSQNLQIGSNKYGNYTIILTIGDKTIKEYAQNMYTKYIDYDKIKDGLKIRTRKTGDKICLDGGKKKIKKLFSDEKIPLHLRDTIPLIVDGSNVVYVVGSRLSVDYYIDNNTKNVLEIRILQNE